VPFISIKPLLVLLLAMEPLIVGETVGAGLIVTGLEELGADVVTSICSAAEREYVPSVRRNRTGPLTPFAFNALIAAGRFP